ncbi:hypothetical protein BamMEX5DRAFT_7043 [Burkholderia ambifaria MEX-5]|uniref:Uncharacterized protein n=1 Tax=Burkholderia ambifaria MEX-5 TaxID=396597 RepID=B1TGX7_9BURK|nr:hypothetical protein BamMEX5DRAFT_7043 [Burkholderia ambifaria MEX-5]
MDVDGAAPVNASDCVNRYDEIDRLTPNSSGPSVISAQYASTRCANGLGLRTRQIRLNADSIVIIVITDVTTSTIRPAVVSPLAFAAN